MRYFLIGISFFVILYACTKDKGRIPGPEDNPSANPTDTNCSTNISYSVHIAPITSSKCALPGCHAANNTFPDLSNYASFKSYLDGGGGTGTTLKTYVYSGYMPQGGPKLSDCEIKKFYAWIDDGYKNN